MSDCIKRLEGEALYSAYARDLEEKESRILELKARIAELEARASDMRMLLMAKDERLERLETLTSVHAHALGGGDE